MALALIAAAEEQRLSESFRRAFRADHGIVLEEARPASPQMAKWMAAQPVPTTAPAKRRAQPFVRPAKPVQSFRTPSNHQKPWRRPRGLSSAARRLQNKTRKGRK